MPNTLLFRMKSKVEHLSSIQNRILDLAIERGFNEDSLFCLRLSMDEAIVNAITHGNKNDETKDVHIKVDFDNEAMMVSIRDEGMGFDRSTLRDPREEPYLHKPHGRGVFLIKEFAKSLDFNDCGNEIIFTIDRNTELPAINP